MSFLYEKCTFRELTEEILKNCQPFDCGNDDLNEFFADDVLDYRNQLMGKSYCFVWDEDPSQIVCAFTVANDSIKADDLPNARKKKLLKSIPREKHRKSYPAVLIGRLGVNKDFKKLGIGRELMDFVKSWFIDPNNKTGCRFVAVDAYNDEGPLAYYLKNDFVFMFSTEEQEREYTEVPEGEPLKTRLMYFDLIVLSSNGEGE
ncbi:MAG: N-acetyltransferase [Flavobacteriales bacterium]|nr:N-acetyltransferase [Flavobacteriales bacterium]